MKFTLRLCLWAAAVGCFSTVSPAAVISYTTSAGSQTVGPQTTQGSVQFGIAPLQLIQFSTSLGQLNSASIYSYFAYTFDVYGGTSGANGITAGGGTLSINGSGYASTGNGRTVSAAPGTTSSYTWSAENTRSNITSGPLFTALQGSGTAVWSWDAILTASLNPATTPYQDISQVGSLTSGFVTVTYDYESAAVPEPGSLGMLALGVGAVLLGCRLRSSRSSPRS